ncbi:MAG: M48 family metallopeptidase [Planctomycetales bacterium]|nr:M48 family metallopeptidase [Planctomycetales bacterium]
MDETIQQLNVAYRRSRRARNLRITIAPTQAVIVTVPLHVSLERAKEFVRSKQAWLQKHLCRIQERDKLQPQQPQLSREELVKTQDDLFSRLENFSSRYNLPYRRATFRCQKTKWGSCSSHNHISLNINIAFLPEHLQDYILLHELCHIRHKNHSKQFWGLLNQYCGGRAKEFVKELKKHRMRIRV